MGRKELQVLREKVLSDCRPDSAFWTCNGVVVRNIYELASMLEGISDCAFTYHVNKDNEKNDFAKWIREVLCDEELAGKLDKILDKKSYAQVIKDRIKVLESA